MQFQAHSLKNRRPIPSMVDGLLDVSEIFQTLMIEVGGYAVLLFLDVILGSVSLAMTFAEDPAIAGLTFSASLVAILISSATSVVQFVLWREIFENAGVIKRMLVVAPALMLAVLDTALDSALSSWIVYGVNPIEFPPENPSPMFWAVYGVIMIITGFNEPLVELVRNRARKKGTDQFNRRFPVTARDRREMRKERTNRDALNKKLSET